MCLTLNNTSLFQTRTSGGYYSTKRRSLDGTFIDKEAGQALFSSAATPHSIITKTYHT